MTTWYYTDEKGERVNVTGGQLKWLAKNGKITPETIIETEDGKTAPARKIKGLTFGESALPTSATSDQSEIYGLSSPPKPLAESNPFAATLPSVDDPFAVASPVAENPFSIPQPFAQTIQVPFATGTASNAGPIWMHLLWLFFWPGMLIIWLTIKDKYPQANAHGKNILNALFSALILNTVVQIVFVIFLLVTGSLFDSEVPFVVTFIPLIICVAFAVFAIWIPVQCVITGILGAIAANKGEVYVYKWAFRFFKTD